MQTILLISVGAIVGANFRYAVAQWVARILSPAFPYGTLLINFSGSLILGLFMVWTTERVLADPRWRVLIAVGFCGGYTTYSSYAYETFVLLEKGQWFSGAWNMILTNFFCLLGVLIGAAVARAL